MRRQDGQILHLIDQPENYPAFADESSSREWPESGPGLAIVFIEDKQKLVKYLPQLITLPFDTVACWIAYPKKSSSIKSDLSRDIIWGILGADGLAPVSQISIDDDWSALRIRPDADVKRSEKTSVNIPQNLMEVLKTDDSALSFFMNLSATNRKEYIRWITDAKRPETVEKRLNTIISRLRAGLRNPSEKPS
ncbi:YdeI/OmpD-associated family protein [Fulvivirga sedimenti]|uniref:YdeI/OmpD-associated family protein n=1 Tax=Fulvivirga sedimenti TaxID=2879465 RepID=A0A9X1KYW0_9BACT|nr:YdeI/OmpD-associated family protein [Fulvivirga sedimenti]MCA6078303.1 YdeI/OmpD-associated family protein [Fulvivirga sedimenti]